MNPGSTARITAGSPPEVEAGTGAGSKPAPAGHSHDPLGHPDRDVSSSWFERSWWTAAGIVVLLWSFDLLAWVSAYPWIVPLVVLTSTSGVLLVMAAWTGTGGPLPGRAVTWIGVSALVLSLACFAVWSLLQVFQAPGYGTDEMAFDQYAAYLLAHGANPYSHSMAPAFGMFHVQPDGYTYRIDGAPVTALSYPALSFLVYVPFVLLGLSAQVAVAVNVLAWTATIVLLYLLLPRRMRPIALVVGSLSVYVGFAVGGVTTALYVPLLAGALYRWRRWPRTRGWRAWVGPGLLGLACCVNQVPWLVVPFVVIAVGMEAGAGRGAVVGLRASGRYLGMCLLVAALPNAVFVAWDPAAWLHGILTPLTVSSVPAGQGLIDLALYLHLGGGLLVLYTVASALALVALIFAFVAWHSRLRPLVAVLPAIALLLATRSYGSYLFGLVPAALVGAVGSAVPEPVPSEPRPTSPPAARRRRRRISGRQVFRSLAIVFGITSIAGLVAALVVPSPLSLRIQDVSTTGQLATVDQVSVLVHNRSKSPQRPHFTLSNGDSVTTFWLVRSGPPVLRPGQSAVYSLLAPNFYAQPSVDGGFQVDAFTSSPDAVSHSSSYLPTSDHLALVPDAVNHVVAVGQQIVVKAELLDRLDRPVHKAHVPVYLGQIIYAQTGLEFGEAIVNGSQPGQTPVSALTDPNGVATFRIVGTRASPDPVYFEANLVNSHHFYPYGYSQILPVRFGG